MDNNGDLTKGEHFIVKYTQKNLLKNMNLAMFNQVADW